VLLVAAAVAGAPWWASLLASSAVYPLLLIACGLTNLDELRALGEGRRSISTGVPALETT
jgi:hypothetical protein